MIFVECKDGNSVELVNLENVLRIKDQGAIGGVYVYLLAGARHNAEHIKDQRTYVQWIELIRENQNPRYVATGFYNVVIRAGEIVQRDTE